MLIIIILVGRIDIQISTVITLFCFVYVNTAALKATRRRQSVLGKASNGKCRSLHVTRMNVVMYVTFQARLYVRTCLHQIVIFLTLLRAIEFNYLTLKLLQLEENISINIFITVQY